MTSSTNSATVEETINKYLADRDTLWEEQRARQDVINMQQGRINVELAARIIQLDCKIKEIQDNTAERIKGELNILWGLAYPVLVSRFNQKPTKKGKLAVVRSGTVGSRRNTAGKSWEGPSTRVERNTSRTFAVPESGRSKKWGPASKIFAITCKVYLRYLKLES